MSGRCWVWTHDGMVPNDDGEPGDVPEAFVSAGDYDRLLGEGARKCRVCGCTEEMACVDPKTDARCSWVEADLCSACFSVGKCEPKFDNLDMRPGVTPGTHLDSELRKS